MPGPLYTYMQDVYRLLGRDETQADWNPDDLIRYINIARSEVAAQSQCVRRTSPVSGSVLSVTVTNPGTGYSNPIATVSPPDFPDGYFTHPNGAQATLQAQQIGGQISNIDITFGGSGYFQPAVTITDSGGGTGHGATATAQVTPIMATQFNQEVYSFSQIPIQSMPGLQSVLSIRSIQVIWTSWAWTVARCSFSKYQALIKQYVNQFQAPPIWCCQFGQGVDGTVHLFPRPDQVYQLVFDFSALPMDLTDDLSVEAIPDPWRNAVQFYAAHLALLSKASLQPAFMPLALQYFNSKDGGMFATHMRRARAFSQPGVVSSYYGRV